MIVAALGDSLTGGYLLDGRFVDDPNAAYPALVAQQIGAMQLGIVSLYGARIETILESIPQLPAATELLLVSAGTNDMVIVAEELRTVEDVFGDLRELLALCRSWMPGARIVATGLRDVAAMDPERIPGPHAISKLRYPERARAATIAFNERLFALPEITPVELAARSGSGDVALFPDAIHPSLLGVRWMAAAVLEAAGYPNSL